MVVYSLNKEEKQELIKLCEKWGQTFVGCQQRDEEGETSGCS